MTELFLNANGYHCQNLFAEDDIELGLRFPLTFFDIQSANVVFGYKELEKFMEDNGKVVVVEDIYGNYGVCDDGIKAMDLYEVIGLLNLHD